MIINSYQRRCRMKEDDEFLPDIHINCPLELLKKLYNENVSGISFNFRVIPQRVKHSRLIQLSTFCTQSILAIASSSFSIVITIASVQQVIVF